MRSILVKQATVVPLAVILVPILIGLALPGYSSISQHVSELEALDSPVALITRAASITNGLSILLFALGAALYGPRQFAFTALSAALAGASMLSNGVFVVGSPLHGLYGLALFIVLVPACFAAETSGNARNIKLSLAASVLTMVYFWLQFSGFDPKGFQGITQRIAMVIMFGWYAFGAQGLLERVGA